MKILAIDTSNQPLTVVLTDDHQIVSSFVSNEAHSHSIALIPAIQKLLADANWQIEQLDRIAVAQGPGSFTGLRIGVTVAKVLADTLGVELVGVSSLAVLAKQFEVENTLVVPMFNARNENVFTGAYLNGEDIIQDQHMSIQNLMTQLNALEADQSRSLLLVGDAELFDETFKQLTVQPTIKSISESLPNGTGLAVLALTSKPTTDLVHFNPEYLRKTQAQLNWEATHASQDEETYVQEIDN